LSVVGTPPAERSRDIDDMMIRLGIRRAPNDAGSNRLLVMLARLWETAHSGEVPNLLTLMRFPTIENWSVDSRRRGTAFVMMICGDVRKQPQIKGGTWTSTLAHRLAIAFGTSAFYGDRIVRFRFL
jgi:hypothetical protein